MKTLLPQIIGILDKIDQVKLQTTKNIVKEVYLHDSEIDEINKQANEIAEKHQIDVNKIWIGSNDDELYLCFGIEVPKTEEELQNGKRSYFQNVYFNKIYKLLISNGYTRIPFNSCLLKEFQHTTVYDLYKDKDFTTLLKYLGLYFDKEVDSN